MRIDDLVFRHRLQQRLLINLLAEFADGQKDRPVDVTFVPLVLITHVQQNGLFIGQAFLDNIQRICRMN